MKEKRGFASLGIPLLKPVVMGSILFPYTQNFKC